MIEKKDKKPAKKRDSVARGLYCLYLVCLVGTFFLVGRIAYIQLFFEPNPKILEAVTPRSQKTTIDPERGAILAQDGRLLAMTVPNYDIYMDCTVKANAEDEWQEKAAGLAEGLASILKDKSADEYLSMLRNGRAARKGYLKICNDIDLTTYNRLIKLPLFNEGKYKGGIIEEHEMIRVYPYGKLARRTIGFVRNNKSTAGNRFIGLEGKFDYELHGEEGYMYERISDGGKRVQDYSKDYKSAKDGNDIRTTLNIDYQDIADRALREQIEEEPDVEGGCLVLMEVSTGAIRAMVNLLRDSTSGHLEEFQNIAIGRRGEPGSVFKTVTLVSVLSDGYIKSLDETMPTRHGRTQNTKLKEDIHIGDYERQNHTNEISIIDGFKMSSNYVFATLAVENYSKHPQEYIDKIYSYKLGEAIDFDLDGFRTPVIPSVKDKGWSNTTLGSIGFGYSTEETPMHILTFYNALANKGKMMKPYLVESIENNGITVQKRGPGVLNASICSKAVADTVARALAAVTEEGTAKRLKNAKVPVAGKTGTSFAVMDGNQAGESPYVDKYGRRKYQGTFVGFFPVDDPQYSIICMVYSKPTNKSFQGGGLPALAVKTVVDNVYSIDPYWNQSLQKTGKMLPMTAAIPELKEGEVPDVKGLGLKDAMYAIENSGFKCAYSGTGHVVSQSRKEDIISIVLK